MQDLNRMLESIEQRLDGEIDVAGLARAALTTEHHLRRMFSALSGMALSEYVRRRRMTVAAAAVLEGDETLQQIAVRFGYTSADAFARAFRAVHGLGPTEARAPGAVLRSQPRLTFRLTIEGSSAMEYRIVQKDAFRVVGLKARVPLIYEGMNPAMGEFMSSIPRERWAAIESLADQEPRGAITVMDGIDEERREGSELDAWAAAVTSQQAPEGLDTLEVPAGTWLVLAASGAFPAAMQQLWPQAYAEWFPANPWRTRRGPELVAVEFGPDGDADAELWLPIEPE